MAAFLTYQVQGEPHCYPAVSQNGKESTLPIKKKLLSHHISRDLDYGTVIFEPVCYRLFAMPLPFYLEAVWLLRCSWVRE